MLHVLSVFISITELIVLSMISWEPAYRSFEISVGIGYILFLLFFFICMLKLPYERRVFHILVIGYVCLCANYLFFIDHKRFFFHSLVGLIGQQMLPKNIWTMVYTVCTNQILLFKIGFLFRQYEAVKHVLMLYMWVLPIFQWVGFVHGMFIYYVLYKAFIGGCMVAHILLYWFHTRHSVQYGQLIEEGEHECVICKETNDTEWIQLDCKHVYHQTCIQEWLKKKLSCPLCRGDIRQNKKFNHGLFMPFIV